MEHAGAAARYRYFYVYLVAIHIFKARARAKNPPRGAPLDRVRAVVLRRRRLLRGGSRASSMLTSRRSDALMPSLEGWRSPCVRGACTRILGCQSLSDYTGSGVLRGY